MVEHTAVNRGVTGSSPVWGALKICLIFFMKMRHFISVINVLLYEKEKMR